MGTVSAAQSFRSDPGLHRLSGVIITKLYIDWPLGLNQLSNPNMKIKND
jgi:hypothetical protein